MKLHMSLSDRIGAKKYNMVMSILNNNKELDITYNEGEFFIIAIKNNIINRDPRYEKLAEDAKSPLLYFFIQYQL